MAQEGRLTRQIIGMLSARIPRLGIKRHLNDPRDARGQSWELQSLVTAMLVGLMAGCKNLAEVERLTAELSSASRKRLGIFRRIADTTMRDFAVALSPLEVCALIRESGQQAIRSKSVEPHGLPLDVVSMDGKTTAGEELDNQWAQTHKDSDGLGACGLVRTITCTLVSSLTKVCLEVVPMGNKSNEVGFFKTAFEQLYAHHKSAFDMVTYDAGAYSAANAELVVSAQKDYLFHLKDDRKFMTQKAVRVLGESKDVKAKTVDVLCKKDNVRVVRRLFMAEAPTGYKNMKTVRTVLRVQAQKLDGNDKVLFDEDRYFISSKLHSKLTPAQWLELVRRHWGVEVTHNILDVAFEEDERPWITHSAQGMLVVLLLRRLAFNLLSLFRSSTLRSEEKRRTPWKTLFGWVMRALEQATEAQLEGLRIRKISAVCS